MLGEMAGPTDPGHATFAQVFPAFRGIIAEPAEARVAALAFRTIFCGCAGNIHGLFLDIYGIGIRVYGIRIPIIVTINRWQVRIRLRILVAVNGRQVRLIIAIRGCHIQFPGCVGIVIDIPVKWIHRAIAIAVVNTSGSLIAADVANAQYRKHQN